MGVVDCYFDCSLLALFVSFVFVCVGGFVCWIWRWFGLELCLIVGGSWLACW